MAAVRRREGRCWLQSTAALAAGVHLLWGLVLALVAARELVGVEVSAELANGDVAGPSLQAHRADHKQVIISGEGRSGSTLVGTLFNAPEWSYHYEPLRYVWPPLAARVRAEKARAPGGRVPMRCAATYPHHCTAANTVALLEAVACARSDRPLEVLLREIDAHAELPQATPYVGARNWESASGSAVDFIRSTGLYGEGGSAGVPRLASGGDRETPADMAAHLRECEGKVGVAAKVIRMTGRLEELFAVADELGVEFDLVIHLVRDPRAVLASRWDVGWLHPLGRSYDATLRWARSTCGGMLADASAGFGRPEYLMLRYEDLSGDVEERAEMVYARIGSPVPDAVRREARVYDGCVGGNAAAIAQCERDRAAVQRGEQKIAPGYNTAPRDFAAQVDKWRSKLTADEIRAVEDGCEHLFRLVYPRASLLSRGGAAAEDVIPAALHDFPGAHVPHHHEGGRAGGRGGG